MRIFLRWTYRRKDSRICTESFMYLVQPKSNLYAKFQASKSNCSKISCQQQIHESTSKISCVHFEFEESKNGYIIVSPILYCNLYIKSILTSMQTIFPAKIPPFGGSCTNSSTLLSSLPSLTTFRDNLDKALKYSNIFSNTVNKSGNV